MKTPEQFSTLYQHFLDGIATTEELRQLFQYFGTTDENELRAFISGELENGDLQQSQNDNRKVKLQQLFTGINQRIDIKSGRHRKVITWTWAMAASLTLFLAGGWLLRTKIHDLLNPVQMETLTTANGQRKHILLTDGSVVWLSPGTSFSYPKIFSRDTRDVQLTGDAFFEVAKDKKHPFIVHTGNVITKVLGTSFHIQAYSEQPGIEVTLLKGKVALSAGNKQIVLLPDQQGIFNKKTDTIVKKQFPHASKFLEQREGDFNYDGEPAVQVVADIQREFNVSIFITAPVNLRSYYGNFYVKDGIELALKKLCLTIGADCEKQGDSYMIRQRIR